MYIYFYHLPFITFFLRNREILNLKLYDHIRKTFSYVFCIFCLVYVWTVGFYGFNITDFENIISSFMPKIVFILNFYRYMWMVKMCEFWFIKPNLLLKELHNNFLMKVIFVCRLYVFFCNENYVYINPIPRCLWANLFHVGGGGSFFPPL